MAITADQNKILQDQYDKLKKDGLSSADATSQIKDKLQSNVVNDTTTAYDTLKTSYNNGGVQGDWIADMKPTPTNTGVVPPKMDTGVSTPTQTGTGATTGLQPKTDVVPTTTTTTTTATPPVIDQGSGKGSTDTFGNQTGQLTPEELQIYNNMTPAEKQQMKADVDAKLATAANYVQTVKKQKDYMTSQEDIKKQVTDIQGNTQQIQSSERIRNAENQLNNLKQNIAYLGTQGKPGVSSIKLDAISRQLANANTTFQNLKAVEVNQKKLQELGIKFDAAQFEKQMTDLQDDLDNKVSKQVQNAINEMTSAEMSGKLDTMEEISAFRTKLFTGLDNQISGVAEVNFTQRAAILKEYAEMENKAMEAIEKSKTIDEKMSAAQGFYVDGNGKAVVSKLTGLIIPIPKEPPIKPMYDEKTGRLVTFETDANGKIVASMQDLIDEPTFTQESVNAWATAVASGKIDMKDVPESVKSLDSFVTAMNAAPGKTAEGKGFQQVSKKSKDAYGNETEIIGTFNPADGTYTWQDGTTSSGSTPSAPGTTVEGVPTPSMQQLATKAKKVEDGIKGGQCGAFVNKEMGSPSFFKNELSQKMSKINSNVPTVGSAIIMDSKKFPQYGHVGIVVGVEGDNVIVKDSNWRGDEKVSERNVKISDKMIKGYYNPSLPPLSTASGESSGVLNALQKQQADKGTFKPANKIQEDAANAYLEGKELSPEGREMLPSLLKQAFGGQPSEGERAEATQIILDGMKSGKTRSQILSGILGYKPIKDQAFADSLRDKILAKNISSKEFDFASLSELINKGDKVSALDSVETAILGKINKDNLGNDKIREDKVKTAVQRATELSDLVTKGESVVGPFEGTLEEWLGRFKSTEAQTLKRKITEIVAQTRNELSGTAVTPSEGAFLEPIIPAISDKKENVIDKIKGLRTEPLRELNNLRSLGNLVKLNETSLSDKSQRAKATETGLTDYPKSQQDRVKKSIAEGKFSKEQAIKDLKDKGYDPSFLGAGTTQAPTTTGRWQSSQPATQGRWQQSKSNQ